jgi:hypothetical protein
VRIRLLGVTASGLGERDPLALFAADDPRRRKAVEATDAVRHRFGERAITRARLVGSRLPSPFERDPMTPVDQRGFAAEVAARDADLDPEQVLDDTDEVDGGRDSLGGTDLLEDGTDAS